MYLFLCLKAHVALELISFLKVNTLFMGEGAVLTSNAAVKQM